MSELTFKTVYRGSTELVDLSRDQLGRKHKYLRAFLGAEKSEVPAPRCSGYNVRGSIFPITDNGLTVMQAGNIEYGLWRSLHCEISSLAVLRSFYGRLTKKHIMGIIANNPLNICTPCGDCRDAMLEELERDFEIVCKAPSGTEAVVTTLEHYLFYNFRTPSIKDLPFNTRLNVGQRAGLLMRRGPMFLKDPYVPKDIYPERKYYALITTESGNTYIGARSGKCDAHGIYAIQDAIRVAERANDPFVQYVVIACEDFGGGAPHVMYKDRQDLLEMNLERELLIGEEFDPPVFLVTLKGEELTGVWETSVKEWLPYPFTPRNFGPEFIENLTKHYKEDFEMKKRSL